MPQIKKRLEAGDRIRFFQDYYGSQWVELRNAWLFWHRKKIKLSAEEIFELKTMLRSRRAMSH